MGLRRARRLVQAAPVDAAGQALLERHGIERIPLRDRRGTPREIGAMWAGATTNVFPVIFGAILISLGLDWIQAAVVIVLGDLCYVLLGLASLAGPLAGTTTFVISRAPFGPNGNRGVGFLNWLLLIGSEMLGVSSCVLAILVLLGKAGIASTTAAKLVVIALATLAQAIVPLLGHAVVVRVLKLLVVPFAAMFVLFAILAADKMELTTAGSKADFATFAVAFALVVSSGGLSDVVYSCDYTRYLPPGVNRRRLMLWVTLGAFVPWTLLQLLGAAVATAVPGSTNPISGLPKVFPAWFLVPYLILFIAQVYAGNSLNLYSSGVTLQAIGVKLARWQAVLVDTTLVTALVILITFASTFNTVITDFLLFTLVWVTPWSAIFLVDLWLRRGRYDAAGLTDNVRGTYWRKRGIHPPGVIAQLAGMAAAAAWVNTSVWKGPLSTATGGADMSVWMGLGVAGALYFVLGHSSLRQEASKAGHPEAGDQPPLSADAA
jgi:purine-cytosine permease-like protein